MNLVDELHLQDNFSSRATRIRDLWLAVHGLCTLSQNALLSVINCDSLCRSWSSKIRRPAGKRSFPTARGA